MKAVILLSEGRHPVSARSMLPRVEACALRLVEEALADRPETVVVGLHAGPSAEVVRSAFGHGLERLVHLALPEGCDPVPALVAALAEERPDLIVAGNASIGGDETGMVPHLLARTLDLPIVADVVAIRPGDRPGRFVVDQARPRGARRRITVDGPLVASIAPTAPAARPFAHGRLRAGLVETRPGAALAPNDGAGVETTPHRRRPKLIARAEAGESRVVVDPTPEEAARLILDRLAALGLAPSD